MVHRTTWHVEEALGEEDAAEQAQEGYIAESESADEPFGELSFVVEVL